MHVNQNHQREIQKKAFAIKPIHVLLKLSYLSFEQQISTVLFNPKEAERISHAL